MEYAALAAFFERLEATSKRLEMTGILVELLDAVPRGDIDAVAYMVQGKVAPDWEGVELGLAEKLILKTLGAATGTKDLVSLYHELGDLGLTAENVLASTGAAAGRQSTLFGPEPLTVRGVYDRLVEIAHAAGAGSQDRKQQLLQKLLLDASPLEARYIIRTVAGRIRLGVADMTFLDALTAWHRGEGVRSVVEMDEDERAAHDDARARLERAYDVTSDIARVARTLALEGMEAVDGLGVEPGVPLRPMAAERLKTLAEILEKHDGRSALEYKYDGLRVQCHIPEDGPVRLFSRRMEELTSQFPDVAAALRQAFQGSSAIVEGECVAVDIETGAMKPFQFISRRRGRKYGLAGDEAVTTLAGEAGTRAGQDITKEIPVAVFLFDCLAVGGKSVMPESYETRRNRLGDLFTFDDAVRLSTMQVTEDEEAMAGFFTQAVEDGAEGIMCKSLAAPYKAGNRGFDWIKYKTDYTEDLVDTLDLTVIGAFYGRGRRAGWYGALLMAVYDPEDDTYRSVCKLGTGFDDETLKGLKERFQEQASDERPPAVDSTMEPDVWIWPDTVMEVQAAEITLSPTHRAAWSRLKPDAGLALRFPRFSGRWRDDKAADQSTTVGELVQMYEEQKKA